MTYFKDLFGRLCLSRRWVAAQFVVTPLLILIGIAWTRLPEKHLWQVALTLLVPLLLAISVLELQAGAMRSLAGDDGKRVKMVWGAVSLLLWFAVVWVFWALLDWCDDQIPQWAGYLNSQAPAHARARLFTYDHYVLWMTILEWVLRWIVVPAKVIPYAAASAQCGLRLPVRRALQLLWDWRWWLGVAIAALVAVWLPGRFFVATPHGTVLAQEVRVVLKLSAAYLMAVTSWTLLLAWAAVLFGRQEPLPESDAGTELFKRLYESRRWVGAQFGWVLVWIWVNLARLYLSSVLRWPEWFSNGLTASYSILIMIVALVVQAGMMRNLISVPLKRVKLVWGTLAMLLWSVLFIVADSVQDSLHGKFLNWALVWVIAPVIYIPFASASAIWGLRLPWRRVLRLVYAWRWWLAVFIAGAIGALLENCFDGLRAWPYVWDVGLITGLKMGAVDMLEMGVWVLLLCWFAVLFDRQLPLKEDQLLSLGIAGTEDKNK